MRTGLKYPADDPRVVACKKAVKKIGGFTRTGRALGITPQAVYKWEVVPLDWLDQIIKLSGLTKFDLRPDIYGVKRHRNRQNPKARGQSDADDADPATATAEEMDGRTAAGGEGVAGTGGDGLDGREGDEHRAERCVGADMA